MQSRIKIFLFALFTPLLSLGVIFAEDYESMYNALLQEYNALSWDFVTCIDTLNTKIWQVSTLSWSLNTCQSDLNRCTNSCDVMVSSCQENLSWCTADLSSMTNYKNSLESQLQYCLAEIPEPCIWTGCDEVSTGLNAVFSFFWERDDNMFSLPISNNIFLPRWITAYIDSWVVALAEEERQKIKIDQWFEVLSWTYYHFFIWIVMLGIFCLFAYYVKKFISKSFIPKEK